VRLASTAWHDRNVRAVRIERDTAVDEVRTLMREYAASLSFDLDFQGFEAELAALPGPYAPPGGVLVARVDSELAGCVAVRPLETGLGELKRLFVRPAYRGLGLGRRLTEAAIELAREAGMQRLRLDTTPEMATAQGLYESLGFREIEPYAYNPVPGTRYLELELAPSS
jgi:ribosomal protein S18 acetylase RimI-like enzyme